MQVVGRALGRTVQTIQKSSKTAGEHWYMWCCRHGRQMQNQVTPVLNPAQYQSEMLYGFLKYWCDQVQKPQSPLADTDLPTTLSDPGSMPGPSDMPVAAREVTPDMPDVMSDVSGVPAFPSDIPHVLHVMAASWDDMDPRFRRNLQSIQRRSTSCSLRFWSHQDVCTWFDEQATERARNCFYSICSEYGAARADLFRYNILHSVGGIWMDHKGTVSLKGGFTEMLAGLPQPLSPIIFATWGGLHNCWNGKLDSSNLLKRGEICNGILFSAPAHPLMKAVVDGVCDNIEAYNALWARFGACKTTIGKDGVLRLTGPLAMSTILYKQLHLYPHLLVDGFGKLGIDFYALRPYHKLVEHNATVVGSGKDHYSKPKSRIVLETPDNSWKTVRGAGCSGESRTHKRPMIIRGSVSTYMRGCDCAAPI